MDLEKRIEWIAIMYKQNLNGRETEDELFEAGIKAGIEETEELTIEFAEFIADKGFNKYTQKSYCGKTTMWFTDKKGIGVTTEELYTQFLSECSENIA